MEILQTLTKKDLTRVFSQALDQVKPSRIVDRAVKTHDFNSNPKRYTKQITGWAKNNILIECWNQWLAYEEVVTIALNPGAKGYELLGEMTRLEQVEMFYAYLGGYLEGIRKSIEEENQEGI